MELGTWAQYFYQRQEKSFAVTEHVKQLKFRKDWFELWARNYLLRQFQKNNGKKYRNLEKLGRARILAVCSCHVTYAFQSESTLYNCLNLKELLARSRREIWSLNHCNLTQTQNHLVCKRTLNHLAKLAIFV